MKSTPGQSAFRNPVFMVKKLSLLLFILVIAACNDTATGDHAPEAPESGPAPVVEAAPEADGENSSNPEEPAPRLTLGEIQDELDIPGLSKPWTGDLGGMLERRVIRVLTVYSVGKYYVDNGQEKGISYELFKMFEDELNKSLGRKHIRAHIVFIPVARDELIPALLAGRGDIVAASMTITPERDELIDFSDPVTRELSEILVTGPSAPAISSIDDLAGREVYVRASSSYQSSLEALNRRFLEEGKEEIIIRNVSEFLEDEDILEMVNTGAVEWAVVDDYKFGIWSEVLTNLTKRDDIVFRSGARIAFAIRENSPELMSTLNKFVKTHRQGTLKGNILIKRYVDDFDWTQNALGTEDLKRFKEVVGIFEKYGEEYGVDYLVVTAQGYQESRLRQAARSKAGAVGIMQLLPSTAADPNVGIPDISSAEDNIHAGVRYLDFIRKRYFNDPEMNDFNKTLFALAAYNAGPARVARLRSKAAQQGYDPNIWFDNVEIIAAREIGRETVQYVSNILKYYVVYRLSMIRVLQRSEVRALNDVG